MILNTPYVCIYRPNMDTTLCKPFLSGLAGARRKPTLQGVYFLV